MHCDKEAVSKGFHRSYRELSSISQIIIFGYVRGCDSTSRSECQRLPPGGGLRTAELKTRGTVSKSGAATRLTRRTYFAVNVVQSSLKSARDVNLFFPRKRTSAPIVDSKSTLYPNRPPMVDRLRAPGKQEPLRWRQAKGMLLTYHSRKREGRSLKYSYQEDHRPLQQNGKKLLKS